jgi:dinuclear metal center YbgI/SA1388 family protein
MTTPTLATVVDALQRRFPPALAESWDRIGLVCGDPAASVQRILFAVDPTVAVAAEAVESHSQLLVTHHPLLLRGVHTVAASTGKGRVVHRLISGGCGLFTMHTNADAAAGGTNDTLAALLQLRDVEMLVPSAGEAIDKLVVFVPPDHRSTVMAALFAAGAGEIGEYDQCAYRTEGIGQFRPSPRADPFIGSSGAVSEVAESRIEVVLPRRRRAAVVSALRHAHPYEEPAFDVWETVTPADSGIGRVGTLPEPLPLRELAATVAALLPATATGVRAAGDPQRTVRRVAICSGAGDSLLAAARATGADVYLTADLRHHPAEEHLAEDGCALLDVSHWASEWPWLAGAARTVVADLRAAGYTVEASVSSRSTDPWSFRVGGTVED